MLIIIVIVILNGKLFNRKGGRLEGREGEI